MQRCLACAPPVAALKPLALAQLLSGGAWLCACSCSATAWHRYLRPRYMVLQLLTALTSLQKSLLRCLAQNCLAPGAR